MKRENKKYKKKSKIYIEENNRDYNSNPELLRIELTPRDSIDRQKRLDIYSYNSKIILNPSFKNIDHNIGLDAKIKHKKKREGD